MFDKLYKKFSDIEKKEFINSFVDRVEIYPEEQDDGRILKKFKVQISYILQWFRSFRY